MVRKLIKFDSYTVGIEDHGILTLMGTVEFEDGGFCNPFGFYIDAPFLYRFLGAIGVERLDQVAGKSAWLVYEGEKATFMCSNWTSLEPLHKKSGTPFILAEYREWHERKMPKLSPYEMRTGKEPR